EIDDTVAGTIGVERPTKVTRNGARKLGAVQGVGPRWTVVWLAAAYMDYPPFDVGQSAISRDLEKFG
ncbi:hypothetical protein, partial [Sinorhizobium medicae]|uniref:hypothetical protein n=1 Tax=Sinorhizobium medicae TaxID=110321 RepID=UPI001AEEDE4C